MDKIATEIVNTKKVLTSKEYKAWLNQKLDQHGIDRTRLMAVVIVIERSISFEQIRTGSARTKPYYRLYDDKGKPTKAWVHAAELALWLKYNGFKANTYIRGISTHPLIQRFIADKKRKEQIPLNVLFPSARMNTDRLKEYSRHFKSWNIKH
jgi:hypothetical protein